MASKIHYDARRNHWWIKYHDGSKWRKKVVGRYTGTRKPRGEPTPPPEVLAEAARWAEAERTARAQVAPVAAQTVADFLDAYLVTYARHRAENTLTNTTRVVAQFAAWCKARKIKHVVDVTRAVCAAYIEHRSDLGLAPSSVRTEVGSLSAAWGHAVRSGRLTVNPWLGVPRPESGERKPRGSWTPEQYVRLLGVSKTWLRNVLEIGTQTGVRISGLQGLQWRDVDLVGRTLTVRPELDKTGRGYKVPLSRRALETLDRLRVLGCEPSEPVLRGDRGDQINRHSTAFAIVRACEKAGLPRPDSPNHHMRRTFGRWAVFGQLTGRPVPLYVVSRWMGHASASMTQRYLQLDDDTSASWMEEA